VGASALARRMALDDIAFTVQERGYSVTSYVRDRTLNEDTDTTVDLIRKGWSVHNYPDRLAFSATPSDFGALLIQRRRWATGGLIILPNVVRYVAARASWCAVWEGVIRAQYILSAPVGSVVVLLYWLHLLSRSIDGLSAWSMLALATYLVSYRRDLLDSG